MTTCVVPVPHEEPSAPSATSATTTTKRALLVLSHGMERAFDSGRPGLVLALFQERAHFDVEASRYAGLAAAGSTVVVAFRGSIAGLPPGVVAVALADGDELLSEWTLVLLSGPLGTALVAVEDGRLAPGERSLQASRQFTSRWTFRRHAAAVEAARLLDAFGDRLPAATTAAARAHVAAAFGEPESPIEAQLGATAEHLVLSLEAGAHRASRLRAELDATVQVAEHDHLTGLHNRVYLERFLDGGPVQGTAVLLVDVDGLKGLNDDLGHLAGDAAIAAVAVALRRCSRAGDVLVRWGGDEFLLLLPGADEAVALRVADRITGAVLAAGMPAPWGDRPLSVSVGVCADASTRIPMERLDQALSAAKRSGKGRAELAGGVGPRT